MSETVCPTNIEALSVAVRCTLERCTAAGIGINIDAEVLGQISSTQIIK